MKKFLSVLIVFSLTFTLFNLSASANSLPKNDSPKEGNVVMSEKDLILIWMNSTDSELEEMGYTQSQIAEIRSYDFEKLFLERAALSEQELKNYGYNTEQIDALKSYNGEPLTANSAVLAATGDVSITFTKNSNTSTSAGVYVNADWSWSIVPIFKTNDLLVVAWQGVNSSGLTINLTPTVMGGLIDYYVMTSGAYNHSSTATGSYDSMKGAVSLSIPMTKNDNYYWAKSGRLALKLVPPTNGSINYINLGASYGHSTITTSISFSVSAPPSLSVSFSPSNVVTTSGYRTGRVTSSGSVTNY